MFKNQITFLVGLMCCTKRVECIYKMIARVFIRKGIIVTKYFLNQYVYLILF